MDVKDIPKNVVEQVGSLSSSQSICVGISASKGPSTNLAGGMEHRSVYSVLNKAEKDLVSFPVHILKLRMRGVGRRTVFLLSSPAFPELEAWM